MESKANAHRRPRGTQGRPASGEVPERMSRLDFLLSELALEAVAEECWKEKHPGIPRYRSPEIAKIRAEVARIKRRQRERGKAEKKQG